MEIRDKLIRLSKLNIGDAVLRIYNADVFDLELLAAAEDELNPKEGQNNGNGSEMDTIGTG